MTHVMGVWHFVSLVRREEGHNDLRQWHLPRYKMAAEFESLRWIARHHKKLSRSSSVPLDAGLGLAMSEADKPGFVVAGSDGLHAEIKPAFWTKVERDLRLLRKARTQVVEEGEDYHLKDARTPAGHPVQSASESLVQAIAFEQLALGCLDPGNFGVYSACSA